MSQPDKPITIHFPSGQVATKMVNAILHNKPSGVSRRSQYPYYKSNYAQWVKKDIDRMIETRQELVYDYSIFCTEESNISELTLFARISQGVRFLVDHLDDDNATYFKWYNDVEISRNKKLGGVSITWKPEFVSGGNLHPRLAESAKEIPRWRRELSEWMESDQKKPFIKENLMLDVDTIKSIKDEYEGVAGIYLAVTSSTIKAIKTL